ncbi:MAG TPA: hypothetical protein VFN75_12505, partial [Pseudonocardiaceae bacterium]|nr:hypothetical protein [Pseudonocardiaceae bacterium]
SVQQADGVTYVEAEHLVAYLRSQPHRLMPEDVAAFAERVAQAYPDIAPQRPSEESQTAA